MRVPDACSHQGPVSPTHNRPAAACSNGLRHVSVTATERVLLMHDHMSEFGDSVASGCDARQGDQARDHHVKVAPGSSETSDTSLPTLPTSERTDDKAAVFAPLTTVGSALRLCLATERGRKGI